jgi:ribosome biogenesis GTPase / thiamine phosphate phosphatase
MEHKQLTTLQGTITLKTTNQYHVLSGDTTYPCRLASRTSNNQHPVVGDVVTFTTLSEELRGEITEILPRRNHFGRQAVKSQKTSQYTNEQILAANIDQVIPVFALAQPAPSWNMLDRFLILAEVNHLPATICLNKTDCVRLDDAEIQMVIADYQRIGYPVILTSAAIGSGMKELKAALLGKTSIFLGKSGVGKTSLLNEIQPDLGKRVREVSQKWKQRGKHTTTCHEMFALEMGGYIIDTPGIRELGLWDIFPEELGGLFREMVPYIGKCKFGLDCIHNEEPGCEVRKAVVSGQISARRYKSYMRMLEDL